MKADSDKCIACKRCFPYCPMGRIQSFKRHEKIHGRVYIEIDQKSPCTDLESASGPTSVPSVPFSSNRKPGPAKSGGASAIR